MYLLCILLYYVFIMNTVVLCSLVEEVSGSINQLNELGGDHEFVSTKTNTLHQSCEHLLEEQTSLMNVAEAIQSKLSYFNELDRINSVCTTNPPPYLQTCG